MGSDRVFRFAPSPNGYLHRGHALSALLNFRAAKATGGRFLLRIEDVDLGRVRPEFEAAIFADLAWLGLTWEEPVLRQREREPAYRDALARLDERGLLYPAFLSRAEFQAEVARFEESGPSWPRDPDGSLHYAGPERAWTKARQGAKIAEGLPYALRLNMEAALKCVPDLFWEEADPFGGTAPVRVAADPAAWGDVVLARKEFPASYHLAVVIDDAFQGVTDVVRGRDLQAATSVHRLLQTLLGLPAPRYWHHPLILDEAGQKLSKSRGSEALGARRAAGHPPHTVLASLLSELPNPP